MTLDISGDITKIVCGMKLHVDNNLVHFLNSTRKLEDGKDSDPNYTYQEESRYFTLHPPE